LICTHGKDGEPTGFDIDLITWIGNEMEFNVNFVPTPWDDIFNALDANEVDMIMGGISITPERLENFLFSDPYLSISQSIAVGELTTMFMDDFYAGREIVGVEGGTTSDDLVTETLVDTGILPEEKFKRYEEIEMGAQDLSSGDIQFFLSDWPVMVSFVQKFPIHIIGNIGTGEKYGIVINKENKELQQIINLSLEQLTASYGWDTIEHKYLLDC
jgi:polar amino acid transport system substrate-binding protein